MVVSSAEQSVVSEVDADSSLRTRLGGRAGSREGRRPGGSEVVRAGECEIEQAVV